MDHKRTLAWMWILPILFCLAVYWHGKANADQGLSEIERDYRTIALAKRVFGELVRPVGLDPAEVALGGELFHDKRLSSNGEVSCASCHDLKTGGDSNSRFAQGVSGELTSRNAPTIYNLAGHTAYFWDGRAPTLFQQIDGPVHNPDELGSTWPDIVKTLSQDTEFRIQFENVFGADLNADDIKTAIVAYQKSLVTTDTPFDRFLSGDLQAMSPEAKNGLNTFVELGCASCHQGNLVGANLMQEFGVFQKAVGFESVVRYKVPSLRNVAFTGPYFHDGHEPTLEGAVSKMARMQLGYELSEEERDQIVAFLGALSSDRLVRYDRRGGSIASGFN